MTSPPAGLLGRWLATTTSTVGKHPLLIMTEVVGARAKVVDELREVLRSHYVAPETTAKRLADLGAPQTAKLLREHVPTTRIARSGDLGEVLATEIAEQALRFDVPVRRLRWKDGRNMPLRGDDIVGVRRSPKGGLRSFLKGESKSRVELSRHALEEAGAALDRDCGRPSRHAVLFVAGRLRDIGNDTLAKRLEEAVMVSFIDTPVEHLLFVLTSGDPEDLLTDHLTSCATKKRRRHAVGVRIEDHASFIDALFGGL